MVLICSPTEDSPQERRARLAASNAPGSPAGAAGAPAAGAVDKSSTAGGINTADPALLAFLYLVDAATSSAESAITKAKQLNGNALAQERLNREASALKFQTVPSVQRTKDHHIVEYYTTHKKVGPWWNFWIPIPTRHKKTWTVKGNVANQATIEAVQSQNQSMFATRNLLEDKLSVLQQFSNLGETGVSVQTQESMQAMQEGSNILQILQSLTFKALLRQPPQG